MKKVWYQIAFTISGVSAVLSALAIFKAYHLDDVVFGIIFLGCFAICILVAHYYLQQGEAFDV